MNNERLEQLDSLRGLAALSVLVGHFLYMIPSVLNCLPSDSSKFFIVLIKYSPLHIFWAGGEAVIFFFVLSGFVLTLPFLNYKNNTSYIGYIIKRICRIYVPYLISLLVVLLCIYLFYRGQVPEFTGLFNMVGQRPLNPGLIINHLFLIGSFENFRFNPAIWSLVQEMRISIIFPFIAYCVIKFNWKAVLPIGTVSCLILYALLKSAENFFQISTDYPDTFVYIIMFVAGSLLAKYRVQIINRFKSMKAFSKVLIFSAGVLIYTYHWWLLFLGINDSSIVVARPSFELIITAAVSVFIILSLSSVKLTKILKNTVIHFLGKISYSLYLYHLICVITMLTLLYPLLQIWQILIISFFLSFAVSIISYYAVELPSMKLGKALAKKFIKPVNILNAPDVETDTVNK